MKKPPYVLLFPGLIYRYLDILYQNDPLAKTDYLVMVPDLYRRRRRRQALRRLPSLPPEPHGNLEIAFNVPTKMNNYYANLLSTSPTKTFPT